MKHNRFLNNLFSNSGGYGTEVLMGTEVSRTPYDCNTSRRNQYNFIYRGNLSTGRLGKLSEFLSIFWAILWYQSVLTIGLRILFDWKTNMLVELVNDSKIVIAVLKSFLNWWPKMPILSNITLNNNLGYQNTYLWVNIILFKLHFLYNAINLDNAKIYTNNNNVKNVLNGRPG